MVVPSLENRSAIGVHLHMYNATFKSGFLYWHLLKAAVGFMKGSNTVTVQCTSRSQIISNNGVFSKLTIFSFSVSFKFLFAVLCSLDVRVQMWPVMTTQSDLVVNLLISNQVLNLITLSTPCWMQCKGGDYIIIIISYRGVENHVPCTP